MGGELDRVGFIVHHPEMFHHYQNVWQHMPAGSVEVINAGDQRRFETIIQRSALYQLPCRDVKELLSNKQRYATAISAFPCIHSSPEQTKSLGRFNMRFMYGNGKAGWNFRPWNSMYDAILCFGPYQAHSLSSFQNLKIQMGYPRFDSYFNEPIQRSQRLLEMGLDPSRKTVVYLPTWGGLCSIDAFAATVAGLQEYHNVIVKPHPATPADEPKRADELRRFGCVIYESVDNVFLFQLADYVVCDYGGSAFGGIYTDRKVILLDVPGAEESNMAGKDSSDVQLRQYVPHLGANSPELLAGLMTDEANEIWQEQRKVRAALRELHFAPYYGYSSQVAAVAILNASRARERLAQWSLG